MKKKKKLRIGILFGGRSGEHEVSLLSAASILKAIDRTKYDVTPIGITREGRWVTSHDAQALLTGNPAPENPRLAGDPQATPTAAVIRRGEAIIVPPVPAESLQPLELSALRRPGATPSRRSISTSSSPSSTERLGRTEPSRVSSSSPTSPTSGRVCWDQQPAWTRTP